MDPYHRTAYAVFGTRRTRRGIGIIETPRRPTNTSTRRTRKRIGEGARERHRRSSSIWTWIAVFGRREVDVVGKVDGPRPLGKRRIEKKLPFAVVVKSAREHSAALSSREVSRRMRRIYHFQRVGRCAIEAGSRLTFCLLDLPHPREDFRLVDATMRTFSIYRLRRYLRRVHLFLFYNGGDL